MMQAAATTRIMMNGAMFVVSPVDVYKRQTYDLTVGARGMQAANVTKL